MVRVLEESGDENGAMSPLSNNDASGDISRSTYNNRPKTTRPLNNNNDGDSAKLGQTNHEESVEPTTIEERVDAGENFDNHSVVTNSASDSSVATLTNGDVGEASSLSSVEEATPSSMHPEVSESNSIPTSSHKKQYHRSSRGGGYRNGGNHRYSYVQKEQEYICTPNPNGTRAWYPTPAALVVPCDPAMFPLAHQHMPYPTHFPHQLHLQMHQPTKHHPRGHSPAQYEGPPSPQQTQQSRGSSPNSYQQQQQPHPGTCGSPTQPPPSGPGILAAPNPTGHVVLLHLHSGVTMDFQMGDQIQTLEGPMTVPMMSTNPSPPIAMPVQVPPGHVVQQIVDESGTLRHIFLSTQGPGIIPVPPHFVSGPSHNTGQPPQAFYATQGLPPGAFQHPQYGNPHIQPGMIVTSPAPQEHSPPPHGFVKDERAHRQQMKLKKKFEQKQRTDGGSPSQSTSPHTPKKESCNGPRRWKDRGPPLPTMMCGGGGNGSVGSGDATSEASSTQDEDDDATRQLFELLATIKSPTICNVESKCALFQWCHVSENGESMFDSPDLDFNFEVLISDKRDGKYKCIYTGNFLSCRVQDLSPATEYFTKVVGTVGGLRGAPSEPTSFTTLPYAPESPAPPKVTRRTRTSIQLKWSSPHDNGSKVTEYLLEYDEGRGGDHFVEIFKGKVKQATVTKLQTAACYKFRLAAFNEYGQGPYSDEVTCTTNGSPPTRPQPPVLNDSSTNHLNLVWKARPSDDEYCLQMNNPTHNQYGFLHVYSGNDTHHVCQELERNSEFIFRLRASNSEGESQWSDEVTYRTMPSCPGRPSKPGVKGRILPHSFKVRWDSPRDNGGSDFISYNLEIRPNDRSGFIGIYNGPDPEFLCSDLYPGTPYELRVSCIGPGGQSEVSESTIICTEPMCPGQCQALRLQGKPKSTSLNLKWDPPVYNGGSPLTEFHVDMTTPDNHTQQVYRGNNTECIVTDLLPGRPYLFQVQAFNRAGHGPWSEPLEVVSGAGPPDSPCIPRVSILAPSVATVEWDQPLNNGASITEYRLEFGEDHIADNTEKTGENTESASPVIEARFLPCYVGPNLYAEVRGLLPATLYVFRVQAVNSAGPSTFSPICQSTTLSTVPGFVNGVRFSQVTCTSMNIEWQEPSNNGSSITHYALELGVGNLMTATQGPVTKHTLKDLTPNTVYKVRVQAVNALGSGPASSLLKVTTRPLPPQPPRLECTASTHNTIKLRWGDNRIEHTQFMLEMENPRSNEFQTVYQGSSQTHKVPRLSEATSYRFRICAANDTGRGPFSDIYEFNTHRAPPPVPRVPRVSDIRSHECVAEWMSVKGQGEDMVHYQVQLARHKEQDFRLVYKGPLTQCVVGDLTSGGDYCVRVCAIRLCSDGGEFVGAYSPLAVFSTPTLEPNDSATTTQDNKTQMDEKSKALTDNQYAALMVIIFTFFALIMAVFIQHFVDSNKNS